MTHDPWFYFLIRVGRVKLTPQGLFVLRGTVSSNGKIRWSMWYRWPGGMPEHRL